MKKTALVISGGGSKGAYATGVVRRLAMEQPDLWFDILVGTSTGALMIPLIALNELDLLEHIYTSVRNDDIYRRGNVGERFRADNSLFDGRPLAQLLTTHLPDQRCRLVLEAPTAIYLATTCLQTGEAVYFTNSPHSFQSSWPIELLENPDQLRRAVLASANQPVFLPPMEVRKGRLPLRQYVDGGIREYAGLQLAIEAGATDIFVILLSTAGAEPAEQPYGDVMSILLRTIDILLRDVGENDLRLPAFYNRILRYLRSVKQRLQASGMSEMDLEELFHRDLDPLFARQVPRIHLVRPSAPLPGGPGGLEFNPLVMREMMQRGEADLSTYLASLGPGSEGNV